MYVADITIRLEECIDEDCLRKLERLLRKECCIERVWLGCVDIWRFSQRIGRQPLDASKVSNADHLPVAEVGHRKNNRLR